MIGIIDYHLNNLRSVQKAFEKAGAQSFISDKGHELRTAEKIVLPGVGAFGTAMENLRKLGLIEVLNDHVASRQPMVGICLGMQLLFTTSHELGEFRGLGYMRGDVRQFSSPVKVPHMGWNQIETVKESPLVKNVIENSFAYFVHSYYVEPLDDITVAITEYGHRFSSIVQKDNIYGIQFHPEKSQETGLQLLKNFASL
ncbi:MAG: imidazole glycerol phosphate synthase subunit HisH [Bacteroidota bacterium]